MILFIKHIEIEGGGLFEEFFKKKTSFEIGIVELWRDEALPSLESCQAIISLGGPMNVYETEDYPFLTIEEDFLRDALAKEIPLLGVCLGAQLLAKVLGAEVRKAEREEMGWFNIELTAEGKKDPLFYNLGEKLIVFQWHEDTFEIPYAGILLARGKICRNQAVRFRDYAWGIQFHLEITPSLLESWFDYYLPKQNKSKTLTETLRLKEEYKEQAEKFLLNFSRVISHKK